MSYLDVKIHLYRVLYIETVQTTIMSGWNKRQISNWSSAGYLNRVQFYNWFRLLQILYQLLTILGGATHYVSSVTEQTLV